MMLYDAMVQVATLPDRSREVLNEYLREHLDVFYSSPQYAEMNVNPQTAYYALYYAAVGAWVTKDITTFLDLICPEVAGAEGDPNAYKECQLDGLVYTEYPQPIMAMAERIQHELVTQTGLIGMIQTMFPGSPIRYMGDDARGMVVACEHFSF